MTGPVGAPSVPVDDRDYPNVSFRARLVPRMDSARMNGSKGVTAEERA